MAALGDRLFHLAFSSTVALNDYVFRAALLLLVLGIIWLAMGEELMVDALRVHNAGKQQAAQGMQTPFKEYPEWLQALVVLLAVFAVVTVALLIYIVVRRLRG